MKELQKILSGGDLRSIGKANEIFNNVNSQKDFDKLFPLLFDQDRLVVMRAIDAIEKITRKFPHFLNKYKKDILSLMHASVNKELKWHIALLLSRLPLNIAEQEQAWSQLSSWLLDKKESRIVRVNSLQALYEMKEEFNLQKPSFSSMIKHLQKENIPSITARLKKIKIL